MITRSDNPIRRFRWRFYMLVDAEPRVWCSAIIGGLVAATIVWKVLSPMWRAGLGYPAWPLAAAVSSFVVGAAAAGLTLKIVAKYDSPETPFPAFYLRLLVDESRAPRPAKHHTRTYTMPDPAPPPAEVVKRFGSNPTATRSPHVCCPHPDDTTDGSWPFSALADKVRRRRRGRRRS